MDSLQGKLSMKRKAADRPSESKKLSEAPQGTSEAELRTAGREQSRRSSGSSLFGSIRAEPQNKIRKKPPAAVLQNRKTSSQRILEPHQNRHEPSATPEERPSKRWSHNYEGYNGAVRYVMKSADFRGIDGAAARAHGAFPEGYEAAIETSHGSRLCRT